jgi:hypothetical protein
MRMILTSDVCFTLFIACGVMNMNWRPIDRRAAWMIISILRSRLTLSMNTSLCLSVLVYQRNERHSQLIETTNRRPHGVPQRKEQTNGRIRLFSTGQRLSLPTIAASFCDVWLHLYKSVPSKDCAAESHSHVYQAERSCGRCSVCRETCAR